MLFPEEDAPLLKAWIMRRLENTYAEAEPQERDQEGLELTLFLANRSDADTDVLADYVIALLQHEGDADSMQKLFEEEIPDFLNEGPAWARVVP
jgi:RNA-binding protein 26